MKFAIEVRPYADETLTSWMIRSAIANGSDPRSFAIATLKKDSTWYRDIDRYLPRDQMLLLARLCNLSHSEIIALTLAPAIEQLSHKSHTGNPYSKWHLVTPMGLKGSVRTSGFYFCPKCLVEEPAYLKKEWKFAWVIACSVHKNLLLLNCEKCGQVFSPHKISYEQPYLHICTNCGFDLSQSSLEDVDKEVLVFQTQLSNTAFANDFKNANFPLYSQDGKDLFWTLTILLSLFVYMNNKVKYADFFKYLGVTGGYAFQTSNNTTFGRMHIKDKEHLLHVASRLFRLPLDEIVDLLNKSGLSQPKFQRTFRNLSPTAEYIASRLSDKKLFKPSRKLSKKILPKSKEEVDRLFDEIREYINL